MANSKILPVSGILLLPKTDITFRISESQQLKFAEKNQFFIALPKKNKKSNEDLAQSDFYNNGVLFIVNNIIKKDTNILLNAHIISRVKVSDIYKYNDDFYASYETVDESNDLDERNKEEILKYMKKAVEDVSSNFQGIEQFINEVNRFNDLNKLMVYLARFMPLSEEERLNLLETESLRARSLLFIDYLLRQKELLKLNIQMNEKFSERANKLYREQALREQLRAIQEELNEESGDNEDGKKDYRSKIDESDMPKGVKKVALEEVRKLEGLGREGIEQNMIRNYLDFLIQLPWKVKESKKINLSFARDILNEHHYGLEKVKERIIQHLAVMQLKNENKGSVLLLVGPPGTGKTSLGKSIAKALDREYIRISLGGVRDEAEIRGHRRTYVGAMPGRILQSIKRAGSMNPVLVLDEIDKLMPGGFSGDPTSAMLEVLDPEQNNTFTDHYLDLPYDLSQVFFIATANSLENIPAPLLDRMEVIQISGYTPDEKFHIGKKHLIPEVLEDYGIPKDKLRIDDDILKKVISEYTLEAGVRGLKKQLAALARSATEKIVSQTSDDAIIITAEETENILGRKISRHEKAENENPAGVVTGLAWTPVGGEILFIETTDMPGSGQVLLTGQLGDVMKESAKISLSLLKSRLPLNAVNFKERDLHIHVPSGAVPKDGPSAGITLFTALASLIVGKKVDSKLAMTGEITLRGEVTPIGGLKEKLYGAQRAGIKKVLIPKDNVADLKEVPDEIKKQLTIIPVSNVEEVLKETLGISLPRMEQVIWDSTKSGAKFSSI